MEAGEGPLKNIQHWEEFESGLVKLGLEVDKCSDDMGDSLAVQFTGIQHSRGYNHIRMGAFSVADAVRVYVLG